MLNGNQDLLAALSQLLVEFSNECKVESERTAVLEATFKELLAKANSDVKLTEEEAAILYDVNGELSASKAVVSAYTHITGRLTELVTHMMSKKMMNKITLEALDKWIDELEPKAQTTKYTIPDYPFFGLIVRPNGIKSIYIKNNNKKMCDVGFLFKGDGFAKVWNDFVNSKDCIRYEDTIKTLIEKYGLPKSGNPEIACNIKDEEHYTSVFF